MATGVAGATAPAPAASGAGVAAGAGAVAAGGAEWASIRASRGRMIAFSTFVLPHTGQATRPRLTCLS